MNVHKNISFDFKLFNTENIAIEHKKVDNDKYWTYTWEYILYHCFK